VALSFVDIALAMGTGAQETLRKFADASQRTPPPLSSDPETGQALVWFLKSQPSAPVLVKTRMAQSERRRHRRNYAQGELSPEQSFYFTGAGGKLNLRAQNLAMFLQIADGVDEETWQFHSQRGDYSNWFESVIKDPDLAAETREVERSKDDG